MNRENFPLADLQRKMKLNSERIERKDRMGTKMSESKKQLT